MIILCLSDEVL